MREKLMRMPKGEDQTISERRVEQLGGVQRSAVLPFTPTYSWGVKSTSTGSISGINQLMSFRWAGCVG
jgi:hypothetical protein